jgi:S1-C subfamily serine protease
MQDVGRLALSRVVTVASDRASQEALGTAWLFDDKGDFVTNAHVVAGSLTVRITDRSAHTLVATVLGSDAANDVAVLRVAGGFDGTALPVRTAVIAELPLPVVDCASSRATGHDDLTVASLSKRGQDVPLEPGEVPAGAGTPSVYHDMLTLTGARVYQGNSGGPVLDAGGQVVGILTLASPDQPESFAIPVQRVLAELKQYAASG